MNDVSIGRSCVSEGLKHISDQFDPEKFRSEYGDYEKCKDMTIAVLVYTYHEDDILRFINNMVERAAYPHRLYFYVAYSGLSEDTIRSLYRYMDDLHIVFRNIFPYCGTSQAYYTLDNMYEDEDYVMHIRHDVSARYNWDVFYINALQRLGDKAYIAEMLARYDVDVDPLSLRDVAVVRGVTGLVNNSCYFANSNYVSDKAYCRGVFFKHDFLFGRGPIFHVCQHDPYIRFGMGNFPYAVRLWTHGYNLYTLGKRYFSIYGWFSSVTNEERSSDDRFAANDFCSSTQHRIVKLYGIQNNDVDLGIFDLGQERTVESFNLYTGINIENDMISINSMLGRFGSNQVNILSKLFYSPVFREKLISSFGSIADFIQKINVILDRTDKQCDVLNLLSDCGF